MYLHVYLFWALVGTIAGLFCALLDEGPDAESDRKLSIQFLSIIVGYVVGTMFFHGSEPDGGSFIVGLIVQVCSSELVYRALRGTISPLMWANGSHAAGGYKKSKRNLVLWLFAILLPVCLSEGCSFVRDYKVRQANTEASLKQR